MMWDINIANYGSHLPKNARVMLALAIIPSLMALSSCAHQRGVVSNTDATIEKERETHTALFFQKKTYRIDCTSDRVNEFSVHQTPANTLVTLLTLGAVMPVEIAYVCAKDPAEEGSTDLSDFE